MKTTKYTFIAILAAASVAAFSPMVQGQTTEKEKPAKTEGAAPAGRGQRMTLEKQVENLTKVLTLTKDQQTKITEILKKQQEERAELRKDGKSREEITAAMKKSNEDFLKVLTEDQKTKYKEFQKSRQNRGGGNRPNRPAPADK